MNRGKYTDPGMTSYAKAYHMVLDYQTENGLDRVPVPKVSTMWQAQGIAFSPGTVSKDVIERLVSYRLLTYNDDGTVTALEME